MPEITSLIAQIRSTPGWLLNPPHGLPLVPSALVLPLDLRRFFEVAGGCVVYGQRPCSAARIVPPEEFQRIDVAISGEEIVPGPFEYWFTIADVADGNYIAIDLHPDHQGLCYDCFHETFTFPGEVRVIADSFSDLLHRLLRHDKDSAFWLEEGFQPLGDAFSLYGYEPEI